MAGFGSYLDLPVSKSGVDVLLSGTNLDGSQNLQGQAALRASTWLEYSPPEYLRKVVKWLYAREVYTGEVASLPRITRYLIRKGIGETLEGYQERVALADFSPFFSHIVDSLAGMMFGVEVDADRRLGSLGDPDDINTPMGKMWIDADGDRNGYLTLWKLLTCELIAIHDAWLFVDGGVDGLAPKVRLLPSESVSNWRYENGVLVEALFREVADTRTSLKDDPRTVQVQFVYMTVDGWQRWIQRNVTPDTGKNPLGTLSPIPPQGPGTPNAPMTGESPQAVPLGPMNPWHYETPNGARTIPMVPVSLPLRRHVGYILARKAIAIFNKESERDHLLRFSSFPLLNVRGNDAQFKKTTDALKRGARAIQVPMGGEPHAFIAPSSEPARIMGEAIVRKVDELYTTGFREYSAANSRSSGNSKTATEVKYDLSTGIAAFLTMVKSAIDDAENTVLGLLEQTLFPEDREKWFQAHVSRSEDFVPFDINEVVERLRTRYFGAQGVVPVGRQARINAAMTIADWDGIETDEQEVAADVDMAMLENTFELCQGLEIPPEAKAEMAVRYLVSTGYVNADAKVLGPDGKPTDVLVIDKLRTSALSLAKQPKPTIPPLATPMPAPGAPAPAAPQAPGGGDKGGEEPMVKGSLTGTPGPQPKKTPQPKKGAKKSLKAPTP